MPGPVDSVARANRLGIVDLLDENKVIGGRVFQRNLPRNVIHAISARRAGGDCVTFMAPLGSLASVGLSPQYS